MSTRKSRKSRKAKAKRNSRTETVSLELSPESVRTIERMIKSGALKFDPGSHDTITLDPSSVSLESADPIIDSVESTLVQQIDAATEACQRWAEQSTEQRRRVAQMAIIAAAGTLLRHSDLTFQEAPTDARHQIAYYAANDITGDPDSAEAEQVYDVICYRILAAEVQS